MDLKAKLDKGIELKNAGNNAFTSNDIKAALMNYHQALLYLLGTDNIQEAMGSHTLNKDPVKQEIKQMIATCYSNMAACLIKEEKWPKVIDYCQKALALDSQNKKAKFRLGQAYLRTGKIELAKEKLQELATSDPEDAAVKRELVLLKEKDKIASVKEKRIYKNMFERMSKEPEN
ncbi:hypothetical protein BGW37DRAFT_17197 [Umbelopsis sp. PMI_123]|nr:hypothetical protein BGW37DRAFT_17197 [Umbelopsis sp. PMI_123]